MTPRTSSAAWVRGITDMLTAQGLPAADLCTQAGIDLQALQQPHTRVDVDRVSHLWELAVARHGNPALGLDRNLTARYGNVDLVGYALASGPDLLTGFRHLERHMAVISDATTFADWHDAFQARGMRLICASPSVNAAATARALASRATLNSSTAPGSPRVRGATRMS